MSAPSAMNVTGSFASSDAGTSGRAGRGSVAPVPHADLAIAGGFEQPAAAIMRSAAPVTRERRSEGVPRTSVLLGGLGDLPGEEGDDDDVQDERHEERKARAPEEPHQLEGEERRADGDGQVFSP